MGGLFRQVQSQIIEDTLSERIMQVIVLLIDKLMEILYIDVEQTLVSLIRNGESDDLAILLKAINEPRTIKIKNKMVA